MNEDLDAGRLNRQFLHLWLAISLCPPALAGGAQRAALAVHPRAALPRRREPERMADGPGIRAAAYPEPRHG